MSERKRRQGNRKMLYLVELYQKEHPDEGDKINLDSVAHWAIHENKYILRPMSPEKLLRRMLSQSLRDDYINDPQEREVRKWHFVVKEDPLSGKKTSTVYAIFNAPPDHMRVSLALRRRSALHDVLQLQLDLDSYNENNKFGEKVPQLNYDFNKDVLEAAMPTDYPLEAPEDIDIDEDDEEDNQN